MLAHPDLVTYITPTPVTVSKWHDFWRYREIRARLIRRHMAMAPEMSSVFTTTLDVVIVLVLMTFFYRCANTPSSPSRGVRAPPDARGKNGAMQQEETIPRLLLRSKSTTTTGKK